MSKNFWGKGYMTEAVGAILQFGFQELELVRLEAKCTSENIGSERVMQKVGMTYEGLIRKGMFIKGKHHDLKLYSILSNEFQTS